jgi:hypothetical protein
VKKSIILLFPTCFTLSNVEEETLVLRNVPADKQSRKGDANAKQWKRDRCFLAAMGRTEKIWEDCRVFMVMCARYALFSFLIIFLP